MKEFDGVAWTGPLPDKGYNGFVRIEMTAEGAVRFSVRVPGESEPASYDVPLDSAGPLLANALIMAQRAAGVGQNVGQRRSNLPNSPTKSTH